jgi:hypothetical protein
VICRYPLFGELFYFFLQGSSYFQRGCINTEVGMGKVEERIYLFLQRFELWPGSPDAVGPITSIKQQLICCVCVSSPESEARVKSLIQFLSPRRTILCLLESHLSTFVSVSSFLICVNHSSAYVASCIRVCGPVDCSGLTGRRENSMAASTSEY